MLFFMILRDVLSKDFCLIPKKARYGIHIPKGQWHSVEVIRPSVILEVKDGPYTPLQPEDTMD